MLVISKLVDCVKTIFGGVRQERPYKKKECIINLIIQDQVLSFPAAIGTPEKFIRRVNAMVRRRTMDNNNMIADRYRVFLDKESNSMTFMVGRSYTKKTTCHLIDAILYHLDKDSYNLMLSSFTTLGRNLPSSSTEIRLPDTPLFLSIQFYTDKKEYNRYHLNLSTLNDAVLIYHIYLMLSYCAGNGDIEQTNDFRIHQRYHDWVIEFIDSYNIIYDEVYHPTIRLDKKGHGMNCFINQYTDCNEGGFMITKRSTKGQEYHHD